jgi:hypothetical protein
MVQVEDLNPDENNVVFYTGPGPEGAHDIEATPGHMMHLLKPT